jgi:hypothetical protein
MFFVRYWPKGRSHSRQRLLGGAVHQDNSASRFNEDFRDRIKQEVLGRTNRLLSFIRHGTHWKRRVQQFFYCCVCIRYRGNVSTEPLPSNDRGIQTHRLTTVEMVSGAVIYVPSFIKIGSGVQRLIRGGCTDTHTHTEQRHLISLLYFFKIRQAG